MLPPPLPWRAKSSIPRNCEEPIMMLKGNVQKLGHSVDTDVMVPGRYLSLLNPADIAKHIFEEVDPDFVRRVQPGDIIVAGENFGCGSGREQAPFGLKALGIDRKSTRLNSSH